VGKSSKSTDRRAVVEQMRRDQRRAEKRRTYAVVAACVAVGLVIIGMGAYPLLKQRQEAAASLDSLGVQASQAGCQDPVTKPANGTANHKPEGTKIFYPDAPPAFGPHYPQPAPMSRKFYTAQDRPDVEYLVHNLEHGYSILWYDEKVAGSSAELKAVKAVAGKFQGTTDMHDKFIAAPWTGGDGKPFPSGQHVALTHWSVGGGKDQKGVWQYCARPSGAVVGAFVHKYPYTDSPEPTAP
jgi:hypothetical protein